MKLKPLGKNIIFIFLEQTSQGKFVPNHGGQILLTSKVDGNNRSPKWGKVFLTGPDVDPEIKVGEYILIEPLMWTPGFDYDGVKFWKTDSDKVMATSTVPHHSF
jgi:hypothetical protein